MPARPIFYDTETTGVRESDYIIEIAAYDPERERTLEQLVRPPIRIPPDATAIHHISDEMVAGAPSFDEVIPQILAFCEGDVILIAHNNDSFDLPFLTREFGRHQQKLPDWRFVDSLKWARKYRRDLPRHSLQFLREIYGFPSNTAHRALDDVIILHQVFQAMTDDLHIEQIYALLSAPRRMQHMPFGKHQGMPLSQVPKSYVTWLSKSGALDKPENQDLRQSFQQLGLLAGS